MTKAEMWARRRARWAAYKANLAAIEAGRKAEALAQYLACHAAETAECPDCGTVNCSTNH